MPTPKEVELVRITLAELRRTPLAFHYGQSPLFFLKLNHADSSLSICVLVEGHADPYKPLLGSQT